MTVEVNDTIERYPISGVGPYPFSFRIFDEDELAVFVDPGDTDSVPLTISTHYTVAGVNAAAGGSITLTAPAAALYAGMTLDIRSNTTEYQPTSIRNQGAFLPSLHEDAFDRLSRQVQDLARKVRGAPRYPDDSVDDAAAPKVDSRKGRYLFANAVTGAFEWITSITTTALSQTIFNQYLSDSNPYKRTSAEQAAGGTPTNFAYPPRHVLRYGNNAVPGTTDMTAAIQAALDVGGPVDLAGQVLKVSSQLTIDVATSSIDGNGAMFVNGLTSGHMLVVESSGGAEAVTRYRIRNLIFNGVSSDTDVVAVRIESNVGTVSGLTFESCTWYDWHNDVSIFTNAFCINFIGCSFSQNTNSNVHVPSGGSNYGERISFTNCFFFNNARCLLSEYPACQFFLNNCSLDYSNVICEMLDGWAFFDNCYVENNLDTARWFIASSASATIAYRGGSITITGAKTREIADCTSTTDGGVRFIDTKMYSATNSIPALMISGTGTGYARGINVEGFANNVQAWGAASARANMCNNGTFGNGLSGWTYGSGTGSGGDPTVDATGGISGGPALKITVTTGAHDQFAYWEIPAEPGQNVGVVYQVKANVAAASFGCQIQARGKDDVLISTTDVLNGTNAFNGTTFQLATSFAERRNCFTNLPAGTAKVRVLFDTSGATATSNTVWVDSVVIGKY